MATARSAQVHRLAAQSPDDVDAIMSAFACGQIDAHRVVAVLGKTEGNGCVNDFTRGVASHALKQALGDATGRPIEAIEDQVAFVMSGGTEGGLSPHWLVFEERSVDDGRLARSPALAIGVAATRALMPEELGRTPQIHATADAVRAAMRSAGIDSVADVHFVQVKCPLLTKPRIAHARARGVTVATEDTYLSMGFSRGASALGVALALGEIAACSISDAVVCRDESLWSARASTSAGIELMHNQVIVFGNSMHWTGDLMIGHSVMHDPLDVEAVRQAVNQAGVALNGEFTEHERGRIAAVLAKCEASRSGLIRGRRHVMLDDSDIHASRHARALVGGVLAGFFGDTQLFVSGGAEHQGPDGGGPIAVIAHRGPQ